MADGSITFSTALDNAQLEKDLKRAYQDVSDLKRKIEKGNAAKSVIEKQMEDADRAIDATKAEVRQLQERLTELSRVSPLDTEAFNAAQAETAQINERIKAMNDELKQQVSSQDALNRKWQTADQQVRIYEEQLSAARERQSQLTEAVEQTVAATDKASTTIRSRLASAIGFVNGKFAAMATNTATTVKGALSNAADGIRARMTDAANRSVSPWQQFAKRIGTMLRRVFVFSIILKGLNAIKQEIGSMLTSNTAFYASIENLKATMKGFLSSIVQGVLPALMAVVNTLSAVFGRIAGFIDSIFGTNITGAIASVKSAASSEIQAENTQKQAEYEEQLADATNKQADAQKKANKQLMAFDELNTMQEDSSDDSSVGSGAGGVDVPEFATDWTQIVPDTGIMQGVLDWLDEIKNRILNDVEGPFARIREGLLQIKKGWDELVEGISTGDWSKVWEGIKDIVIGACKVIEGSINAFLDWFDEQTNGRFHNIVAGLQNIVSGLEKVIEGILTGNLQMIIDGACQIFDGLRLTVIGIAQAIKSAWSDLMSWLDEQTGGQFHDIFAGLSDIVSGAADIIIGILSGDIPMAVEGLRTQVSGSYQFLSGIITVISDALKAGVTAIFDYLAEKYPEAADFFHNLRDLVLGIIDGVTEYLTMACDGWSTAISGMLDIIMGLLTGDAEKVEKGFNNLAEGIKTIVDGLATGIKGIITSVFNFLAATFPGLSKFFNDTKNMINKTVDDVATFIKTIVDNVKGFITGVLDILLGLITGDIDKIHRGIDELCSSLQNIISGFGDAVHNIVDNLLNWMRNCVDGLFDWLVSLFPEYENELRTLQSFIQGVLDFVSSTVHGVINGITTFLSGALNSAKSLVSGAIDVIVGIFTGSGDRIVAGLKGIVNGFFGLLESLINGAVNGILGFVNGAIDAVNSLGVVHFDTINFGGVSLPRLAQGAVIPPNREFMAILGDQKSGTNIETPESLMRQVVRDEAGKLIAEAILALSSNQGGGDINLVLTIDGEKLAQATEKGRASLVRRGIVTPNVELDFV